MVSVGIGRDFVVLKPFDFHQVWKIIAFLALWRLKNISANQQPPQTMKLKPILSKGFMCGLLLLLCGCANGKIQWSDDTTFNNGFHDFDLQPQMSPLKLPKEFRSK